MASLPIIAIRPQPGCSATVAAGKALGLAVWPHPLFAIRPVDWIAPDPANFDALLIGSANAIRHGGDALAQFASKPVYAVGQATADAALASGLTVAAIGTGGLQGVIDHSLPPGLTLLRLSGEEHVPLTVPAHTQIVTRIIYRSEAQTIDSELSATLSKGALVLLHSAAAARHFAAECDRLGLPRHAIRLAALGPRIAESAGAGWSMVESAAQPDDRALLALVQNMCH